MGKSFLDQNRSEESQGFSLRIRTSSSCPGNLLLRRESNQGGASESLLHVSLVRHNQSQLPSSMCCKVRRATHLSTSSPPTLSLTNGLHHEPAKSFQNGMISGRLPLSVRTLFRNPCHNIMANIYGYSLTTLFFTTYAITE
jgi:hypothetical protein